MTAKVEDLVILVTGANGLIGKQFAGCLANLGATVVRTDMSAEQSTEGRQGYVDCDIRDKNSVDKTLATVVKKHGRLDALVNCAYPRNDKFGAGFFDVTYDDFCENLSWQLGGTFLVSQQAARVMKKQGSGSIVNFGSIYGIVAPDFSIYEGTHMGLPVEYAAIKSGVIHLTKYMARYLKGTGVRVNCISPGGVLDGQPQSFLERYRSKCSSKGMLAPADLESALLFLLSPLSLAVTGQNIIVDDGFTL
jgi:NAD(P)-dependent dehydrogenase (short-subunit alcohol dehydrogenase family)